MNQNDRIKTSSAPAGLLPSWRSCVKNGLDVPTEDVVVDHFYIIYCEQTHNTLVACDSVMHLSCVWVCACVRACV